MNRRDLLRVAAVPAAAALLTKPSGTYAQERYPSRPIRIIVANPPGGPGDLLSRSFGDKATQTLAQPFIIENRAGASTVIGTQAAARSEPDGYTLFNLTTSGVVQTVLQDSLPYNLSRDFVPVIGIGYFPMVIIVSPSSGIQSMADLQARARRPGGINFGSGGTGTLGHLAGASLLSELGGRGTHVSYRGSAPAVQGVISGEIDMFFGDTLLATSLKDSVRLLALTSKERMPVLPDVPTTAELGLPGLNSKLWFAFLAPSATPQPILKRLYDAFSSAEADQAFKEKASSYGFELEIMGAESCSKYMQEEASRWGQVIKANGIRSGD
jgi:tripartite-type tricarboxylate transporter receptor subunit TctC